ncbi:unnamed protein product [Urochloa humidicola]
MRLLAYKIVRRNGKPNVEVAANKQHGDVRVLSPEEISAMVLAKMKEPTKSPTTMPLSPSRPTSTTRMHQANKDADAIAVLHVRRI